MSKQMNQWICRHTVDGQAILHQLETIGNYIGNW